MTILTLIPEAKTYGIAILLTLSLGCSNIASHIQSRWFAHRQINSIFLQWLVKFFIIIFGIMLFPIQGLLQFSWETQLFALPCAVLLSFIALKCEIYIKRALLKKIKSNSQSISHSHYIYHQTSPAKKFGITHSNTVSKTHLKNIHEHHARQDATLTQFNLRDIILVAVTEEIIFRGFLWQLALLMPSRLLTYLTLMLSVILFGASHISMGRGQFLSKTILGLFCLIPVLLTHCILPAILIHVVFNICAYHAMKTTTQQYTQKRGFSYAL